MSCAPENSQGVALPSEFAALAVRLAIEISAPVINESYQDSRLRIDQKPDRTPVTRADRDAEQAMREILSQAFPDHGVIGEEFGTERDDAEWVWVLDPIDGTLAFIHGVPLFTTLIGLLHRGRPVLGIIHQPTQSLLCMAYDGVCRLNGRVARCAAQTLLEESLLLCTDFDNVVRYQPERCAAFDSLRRRVALCRTWADGYGYLLLATGRAHIMADPIVNPWDILPVIPIVEASGAMITDWAGRLDTQPTSALAAPPRVHQAVIKLLNHI